MSNSSTIIEQTPDGPDYSRFVSPSPHPGEHLREDYLPAYDLTPEALAKALDLADAQPIHDLLAEQADLTADLALRLGRLFNQSPELWIGLQTGHDLSKAAIAAREAPPRIQPLVAA